MCGGQSLCGIRNSEQLNREFGHVRSGWFWFFLYGVLMTACGTAAVIFPALTVLTTLASMIILGVALMIGGVATIVTSLWAGKWSGMLVQLLVGILYVVAGFAITDTPMDSALGATILIAAFFIVVGAFRTAAALTIQFPHWGWALLNGVITLLLGIIVYRHAPEDATWVIGLLVGIELIFNGWMWITLSLAIKNIPAEAKAD